MSTQNFHQSMFTFPNGYNRSTMTKGQVLQDPGVFLIPIPPQEEVSGELQLYETGGTLSEMFGFGLTGPTNGILNHQISSEVGVLGEEKYLTKQNDGGFEFNFDANLVNSMQISTTLNSHVGVESHQGLSLSLSSSLQRFEDVKFEGLRVGNGGLLFSNNLGVGDSLNPHIGQVHVGFGINTSLEMVNFLRNSKYLKPAQELLEEFCCVGRGQYFNNQRPKKHCINPNSNIDGSSVIGSSSSLKEYPPLSSADKTEYQRRKINLLSMLDEVERRYRDYREKMQTMVNSFDSVMGVGAAMTYTALAQKAMSRHFRCIKSAIEAQLKLTCERLGEQQGTSSGLTKGETPRLRLVEQSLRQQKAIHHMGMMMPELETWRPQRGLPEPSVNTLRAWLFEHFLHPYPSDADKHLLSRQTGLSKNQVSNWFINARVRLWKPMIEEMYQKEATDKGEQESAAKEDAKSTEPNSEEHHTTNTLPPQTPMHKVSINGTEKNQPPNTFNYRQYSLGNQVMPQVTTTATSSSSVDTCRHESVIEFGDISADLASSLAKLGAPAGDVSLTLGLRHAGNLPEKRKLMVRNFGTC